MRRVLALSLLVVTACSGGAAEPDRDETGQVVEAGDVRADRVRVGDCFDDQPPGAFDDLPVVPCAEPHDNEVFALFDLRGDEWRGQDSVTRDAQEGCIEALEAYVGRPYDLAGLEVFPLTPSQQTWEDDDDREVICALYDPAGLALTGSQRGGST